MTRMTELTTQRRIDAALAFENQERLLRQARRLQSQYMGLAVRKAATAIVRATGLTALANALRRHAVYRRTVDELSQLDDGVLADIGVTRSEIYRRALECSREAVPATQGWWKRLGDWLGRVRDEQRTVRELARLDARMLRDIGIEPGSLRGTAERMTGPSNPMVVEAVSALREAAVVIFAPFKQSRDRKVGPALDEVERITGKRAA